MAEHGWALFSINGQQHDKISPALLTLFKAMFVIDPVQEISLSWWFKTSWPTLFFLYSLVLNVTSRSCVFNAWHRFTLHRVCPLSLSLPGAIKSYMALFASFVFVPVTTGPSISPSPSLSSSVSFPIEAEIRLFPCLCFTTSRGLSWHLLFNSIIPFYMHNNHIWIWLVWKKLGSKPEANSLLLNPPPSSIVILLQSWTNAPRGPTSEHWSGQQILKPNQFLRLDTMQNFETATYGYSSVCVRDVFPKTDVWMKFHM